MATTVPESIYGESLYLALVREFHEKDWAVSTQVSIETGQVQRESVCTARSEAVDVGAAAESVANHGLARVVFVRSLVASLAASVWPPGCRPGSAE